jgi:hypothetical protein
MISIRLRRAGTTILATPPIKEIKVKILHEKGC